MFETTLDNVETDRITRYRISRSGVFLTYSDVLELWQQDADFRNYYSQLLAESPFPAYRWETPALTSSTVNQTFEFVLLNCPSFDLRQTDPRAFERYFVTDENNYGIAIFANISGDATLIVPSPRTDYDAYGHLATFIRNAPKSQLNAFWRVVGTSVTSRIGDNPLWLNTAGGGVAWLHVRLESRPKYYGYSSYKAI